MRFPTLALSGRYDGDGRRLAFQIRPSVKQVMREALKRDAGERRAATARARLIEKAEANGYSTALHVDPLSAPPSLLASASREWLMARSTNSFAPSTAI
jgi:hypothetical protein